MMSDFPGRPLTNMAGLASFQFVPYHNLGPLPPIAQNTVTNPVAFLAGGFYTGYATVDTLLLNETQSRDDSGEVFTWEIDGFVPGDTGELGDLMYGMAKVRHLVVVRDYAGVLRLVGYNAPLTFTADYASGKQAGTDAKGYNFKFEGEGRRRAPVYNLV
jgi:hypothetical protein